MYSEIAHNKQKTVLLIGVFLAFIAAMAYGAGWWYNNFSITIGALIGGAAYALFSYFVSARAALAFNGAKPIEKSDNPRLYRIVENLAITEGMPMPKVHIIQDAGLNAFATGRDPEHASVAVTTGLLDALEDSELQGVMAHELGHIKNYDIRVSMIVFGLVAVVSIMADILFRMAFFGGRDNENRGGGITLFVGIAAMIIAPIVAGLIQAAISRKREYLADATGAMTTRYPEGLARALEKIQAGSPVTRRQNTSTAHLFFANPLKAQRFSAMFSTHPPIQKRIAILRELNTRV